MPTVATEGRFRFVVNTRENAFEPPHVHPFDGAQDRVWTGNEDVCRIELNSGTYTDEPPPGTWRDIPSTGLRTRLRSIPEAFRSHQASLGPHTQEIAMGALAVQVSNADRMMTYVCAIQEGLEVVFADGCKGLVPFTDIPEIAEFSNLVEVRLPNPYEVILRNREGRTVGLPWDFARHYCDVSYRPRIERIQVTGRQSLGKRIRQLREAARATQEELSAAAGVSRITLVRIENGEQSPRYETLIALARALGRPLTELLVD